MGRISRYSVGTSVKSIRLDGACRVVIRVETANVRIAYDLSDFDNDRWFEMQAGEVFVFDPNPVTGEADSLDQLFYMKTNSGTATVSVWLQGGGY
jgi:hypothetical protein